MFERPRNIPYPNTWRKFNVKKSDESSTSYEIRDLIDEHLNEALNLMTTFYLRDEPISKLLGVQNDPDSVADNIRTWKKCQTQRIPIACYDTSSNKIVGLNFLCVINKDDPEDSSELKCSKSTWGFKLYERSLKEFNAFDKFNVDKILMEFGLGTHPDHRYQGVATQLLLARVPLMKAMGIKHALTGFSAVGSQRAGEKAGYRVVVEYKYEDLIKEGYPFQGIEGDRFTLTAFSLDE